MDTESRKAFDAMLAKQQQEAKQLEKELGFGAGDSDNDDKEMAELHKAMLK
jgi:hypothetical protein